jgi:hypothetical protein
LITGAFNRSAIATLVERTSRYVMLVHIPEEHSAEIVRDGLIATMGTLPEHLRGSLTWDQGVEMANHKSFSISTGMDVYFCDPASPWQRGSNENTNGLLRQYFPKRTDLSVHGPEDLERVAQELNGRPRKTLDWDTPAERLRDLLLPAKQITSVATTAGIQALTLTPVGHLISLGYIHLDLDLVTTACSVLENRSPRGKSGTKWCVGRHGRVTISRSRTAGQPRHPFHQGTRTARFRSGLRCEESFCCSARAVPTEQLIRGGVCAAAAVMDEETTDAGELVRLLR